MNDEKDKTTIPNSEQLNHLDAITANPSREFFDFIFDLLKTGLIVFVIAFILRYFAVQPYIVDGESMMPNFHNKEYLLAEKVSFMIGQPKRGDVVIFKYPKQPSENYIKRIIGLPGETVKISNNQIGIVAPGDNSTFSGQLIDEVYIPTGTKTSVESADGNYSIKLSSDEYFVLGDNREHSSDSREWGILPKANILGRAWLTLYPFDNIKIDKRISYTLLSDSFKKVLYALD